MTKVSEFKLKNGLTVLIEEQESTPLVTVNILYKVGSKNEVESKTGFAHLFEHFMFEGSKNIPHFDSALQVAGGDNNAFTSVDLTNYYETLPASNIETAFWLESDRMLELNFNQGSLNTQISVVCEEFKQNYLNRPYGDVWHLLMEMCYKVHPYKWPTIGKNLQHIEEITLQETKDFFYKYYRPNNAILSIIGGIKTNEVLPLVEKWFEEIPAGPEVLPIDIVEPPQESSRFKEVERDVPSSVLYKAYHVCNRTDPNYYTVDIISELLGTGDSCRLAVALIDELNLCTEVDSYLSGSDANNLLIIEAKPNDGVSLAQVDVAIKAVLISFCNEAPPKQELEKVINKACNYLAFTNEGHSTKAFNLAYFKSIDSMHLYNHEQDFYQALTPSLVQENAKEIFQEKNSSTLFYKSAHHE
jgi:predicted Zn-dependent peptidase